MKSIIPILTVFLILGCEDEENKILEANALLRWTGDYAVDGCGFFIDIGDHEYKPKNEAVIDDSLKIDEGVEVFIKYELLVENIIYNCGNWIEPIEFDAIKLHSIENR